MDSQTRQEVFGKVGLESKDGWLTYHANWQKGGGHSGGRLEKKGHTHSHTKIHGGKKRDTFFSVFAQLFVCECTIVAPNELKYF